VKKVMVAAGERVSRGLRAEPRLTPAAGALLETDVPVIAAVNGAAVGWGMELAVMADLRIASERAKFGELFVKRGLCCDVAGIGRLASLVGRERAAELLFTGRVIDAGEATRAAARVARRRARASSCRPRSRSRERSRRTRRSRSQAEAGSAPRARPRLARARPLGDREPRRAVPDRDHREGVASFLERREPHYVGR
jgi:enoyl-CoA hydratase